MNPQLVANLQARRKEIIEQLDQDLLQELDDIDRLLFRAKIDWEAGIDREAGNESEAQKRPVAPLNTPDEYLGDRQAQRPSEGPRTAKDESWKMVHEPWMDQIDPQTKQPYFTREEVERVNRERQIAIDANAEQAKGISFVRDIAKPQYPPGWGIKVTPVGQTNRAGDVCLKIDHRGMSVFQCKNVEHGYYADENPSRIGCSKCFMGGGGVTESVPTETSTRIGQYQQEDTF